MIDNFRKSDEMVKKAQLLIPAGCHTYSKGADQSPLLGPKFIAKGKGSHVWDVDGNEYIDWAMGLTAVSLGHAYEPVLAAVRGELENGTNFQCPSPIEIELAETFLSAVKTADMVKFAKNGSTVTTAAVKLARAYTGRKYAAYCADHGFFSYDDWYMGLKPNNSGVLPETAAFSLTFKYNDINSVKELFAKYPKQIACIILEPMEFDFPQNNFLHEAQKLCRENGALFIIDEMITGFKLGFPGAHTAMGLDPDLTTWGKGVANGFSTCMLAGKRAVMELGGITHNKERVFLISTTHGAETHALRASIATLNEIKRTGSVDKTAAAGKIIAENINQLINQKGLGGYLSLKGHSAWQLLVCRDAKTEISDGFKTLVMQECAKRGLLFRGAFVPTISHTEADLQKTFLAFNGVFDVYKKAVEAGGYEKFLTGSPVKPVFRKFN